MAKRIQDDIIYQMIVNGGGGGGGITPTGTKEIAQNGLHDVAQYANAQVAVPPYGEGSVNISANGTVDVSGKASAVVAVPNSYDAGDEGKVVDNGALVAQTSKTVTENGTVDTTKNNEIIVNVSGSGVNKWAQLYDRNTPDKSVDIVESDLPNGFAPANYAFANNKKIRSFSSTSITEIKGAYSFQGTDMSDITLPNLSEITGTCIFQNAYIDNVIRLGTITSLSTQALAYISTTKPQSSLEADFTQLTALTRGQEFRNNMILRSFDAPNLVTISGIQAFSACYNLQWAKLPKVNQIPNLTFQYCSKLEWIQIGGTSGNLVSLAAVTALNNELEAIYVPDDLVEDYKVATNWSAFASLIKPESEMPSV